ncbi:MAG: flagellar protein FliT [Candidatus Accumulibacter sp.]|uniref:flagellar protein FliT n=1 Tax=Accumulibacter sp. TaxID=2053492 RepID=UPI001A512917|nr:flagellar protein FliT [Accumulibacter sp.]MBL8395771.1 flagellar protein FliT [Accumulibacter sp.]
MNSSLGTLEQLLAFSEAMLGAAERGEWESLASHEAARRALVAALPADLAHNLAPTTQARARALVERCQDCDAALRPLVDRRLQELRVVLREAPSAV